jgi:hypothetical protein
MVVMRREHRAGAPIHGAHIYVIRFHIQYGGRRPISLAEHQPSGAEDARAHLMSAQIASRRPAFRGDLLATTPETRSRAQRGRTGRAGRMAAIRHLARPAGAQPAHRRGGSPSALRASRTHRKLPIAADQGSTVGIRSQWASRHHPPLAAALPGGPMHRALTRPDGRLAIAAVRAAGSPCVRAAPYRCR